MDADLRERWRETPPALPDLTWRALSRDDLPALVELGRSCLWADGGLGFLFQPDSVRERYLPAVPTESLGAFLPDGSLVAAAAVHLEEYHGHPQPVIHGQVRPEFRNLGIGSYLMRWSETAAALLTASTELDVIQLSTESLTDAADRLYRTSGFAPVDVSLVMRRDLGEPLPDRWLPAGVKTISWKPELADQFAQAYEPAFADRPGFPGWSSTEWTSRVTDNDLVSEWTLLARSVDTPVGFVIGCADSSISPPGGYVWQVGVAAHQRRRGIGSALLVESMRQMQTAGSPWVQLVVNADNPVAIRAYERLGFQIIGRRATYERLARAEISA